MRVVVIGGTGTIGSEVVRQLSVRHDVAVCARGGCAFEVHITSTDSIGRLFEATGTVDAVVCLAGEAMFKPFTDMSEDDIGHGLASKLMNQVNVVRVGLPFVSDGGSFTLTSGVTSRRPIPTSSGYSLVNWTPDGSGITYAAWTGDVSLLAYIAADGTGQRLLTATGTTGGEPELRPVTQP